VHQGASASQERQTMFEIVTWTKQTWTKHHNTTVSSRAFKDYLTRLDRLGWSINDAGH